MQACHRKPFAKCFVRNMTRVWASAGIVINPILTRSSALPRISLQVSVSAQPGEKWQRFTLEVQPRSLYMMSGELRSIWEHSIPPVETSRYSITFRTMVAKHRPDK